MDCWVGLFEGHDVVNQRHLSLQNLQGIERVQNFLLCDAFHMAVCLADLHICYRESVWPRAVALGHIRGESGTIANAKPPALHPQATPDILRVIWESSGKIHWHTSTQIWHPELDGRTHWERGRGHDAKVRRKTDRY